MKRVVVLDDDHRVAALMSDLFSQYEVEIVPCASVAEAKKTLSPEPADFYIVDLCLLGSRGAELSNGFIEAELIPRQALYGRVSSTPEDIPTHLWGHVEPPLHKRSDRHEFVSWVKEVVSLLDAKRRAA